ncbi:hypothetical protein GCM10025869_08620 [Homoserinibacter gongjuensis]|uniref:Glycosyl hydrolase family 13 catalytic domain-containing protein n=1 Tax=Homoserinibacter gongjuensis TaxID=1162968 RepID=A0ABQ6JSE6_9MICO|nr:hypothetical protein GCM10025869_08620 [Homoserinibacter gongjuensis]
MHGLSAARPTPAAPLATPGWAGRELADAMLYELHIGTFTPGGTLDAAIDRLDHLVRLGVDAVELLPVNAFNGVQGWGYDGVAWYAVHAPYGGPDAYLRFVEAAHARGLAVIQDVVYNHLGPSGNYLPEFGPYLREDRNSWGETLDLDEPEVRRYILDNAALWFEEYAVDGLRLDAVHALDERGAPTCWPSSRPRPRHARRVSAGRSPSSPSPTSTIRSCSRRARRVGTASPPSGATTTTTPCTSRSPERRRATTPTSRRSPHSALRRRAASSTRAATPRSASACTATPSRPTPRRGGS